MLPEVVLCERELAAGQECRKQAKATVIRVASQAVSDLIATHQQPPDADFLVHADLAPHGLSDAREQLWVKQIDERRFAMRSLPFFTYGIALGDKVSTDETLTIADVLRRSGHRLMRVTVDGGAADHFHKEFHPLPVRQFLRRRGGEPRRVPEQARTAVGTRG